MRAERAPLVAHSARSSGGSAIVPPNMPCCFSVWYSRGVQLDRVNERSINHDHLCAVSTQTVLE